MSWPAFFYPHVVSVKALRSSGGMGDRFDDPRDVSCEVRDEQRLVRTADNQEVVSSTQVTVPLSEDIPIGSLVTVWPGGSAEREAKVLAIGSNDNGDSPLDSFRVLSLE